MLKTKLINPLIISKLASCGHGSRVLIADGNYPLEEKAGDAELVYLGLSRGVPTVTEVLSAIHSVVNIEKAEVMVPDDGTIPEIFNEFTEELGEGISLCKLSRRDFYNACMGKNSEPLMLAISTGEQRVYANILITIGVA